ncbi:hypothetical protein [Mesorhizobium sp. WSM3868]|uniref:hypothetical protein n=1 Tax=Mesorhizobium sp. WSM3868 TaxID=2029405 RepID=UPI0015C86E66|nr:hypothetical protein [Mesorhizobium sp. WSM3868]
MPLRNSLQRRASTACGLAGGRRPIPLRADPSAATKMLILQQKTPKWALDALAKQPPAR